ncbi:MAG: type IV pilus assembly protein PilV [Gammaproteobacteria bacterium]|jgi:type IV pilus assembly protein PilV
MNKNKTNFRQSRFPMRSSRVLHGSRHESGFTLLEVLVAMLVLAVGLLGVAAMQMRGLQYSHDAYLRSQISILAYDIADRMRLNKANATSYASTYTVPAAAPGGCTISSVTAANDLACWHRQVFDAIPPGSTADIILASGEYTVELEWQNRDGTIRTVEYTFIP